MTAAPALRTARVAVRAPGKAMLCGEYAVLAGAPAVVAAIDRHACARVGMPAPAPAPMLDEATRRACSALQLPAEEVAVDSSALCAPTGEKLGLGSSAASLVAAIAAVFETAGRPSDEAGVRHEIFALADTLHRRWQSGRGSGVDVLASTFGGLLEVRRAPDAPSPTWTAATLPRDVCFTFVWTGRPASTEQLLGRILAAPGRPIERLCPLAEAFALACRQGDGRGLLSAARAYGAAMQALGEQAGCPLVTREHALLAALAERHGGVAKPSGAGGGDLAVAFFLDPDGAAALQREAHAAGLTPLDLTLEPYGVRKDPEA